MKSIKYGILDIFVAGITALVLSSHPNVARADTTFLAQATGFTFHVLFTGTFYEPGQAPESTRQSHTLDVIVAGEKRWVFIVDKAVSLGRTATEIRILKSIFPPQLSFRGDKKGLDFLSNPNIAGKTLTINGHLYSKQRRFQVLRAEPITEEEGEEEKAES